MVMLLMCIIVSITMDAIVCKTCKTLDGMGAIVFMALMHNIITMANIGSSTDSIFGNIVTYIASIVINLTHTIMVAAAADVRCVSCNMGVIMCVAFIFITTMGAAIVTRDAIVCVKGFMVNSRNVVGIMHADSIRIVCVGTIMSKGEGGESMEVEGREGEEGDRELDAIGDGGDVKGHRVVKEEERERKAKGIQGTFVGGLPGAGNSGRCREEGGFEAFAVLVGLH